jgi:hypothetical protein
MKLTVVLAVLIGTLVLACSAAAPAPAEPTPNIDATVEARLAQERAVDATLEARLKEERASQPTSIPSPTNTQAAMPTYTPNPTYTPKPVPTNTPTIVPTATSVPTPTPRPIPTGPEEGRLTPDGKLIYRNGIWQLLVPLTPTPPTKFEGGFVMLRGGTFRISGEISFKIGQYVAEQTVTVNTGIGQLQLLDLYAISTNSEVPYTAQTGYEGGVSPPNVIAGRAYIDGEYAPDGTLITAWIGGEEIIEYRTTVVNNPVALVPTELVSKLETLIPPPSPLPTPCPKYMNCGTQYYSGTLSDGIEVIWDTFQDESERRIWWFYSPDPAWRLANNLPENFCDVVQSGGSKPFSGNKTCHFGGYINAKTNISFDTQANGLERLELVEGWNSGSRLEWPVQN